MEEDREEGEEEGDGVCESWGLKKKTRGTRRILVGDDPENSGRDGGGGKVLRRRIRLIFWRLLSVRFTRFRGFPFVFVWREATDEPREETRTDSLEERPAEDAAARPPSRAPLGCAGASAPFRLPSLPHIYLFVCLFIYLFVICFTPHPPSSPSIS